MFTRKIEPFIEQYLTGDDERILCIDGARQVGKSFIIRHLSTKHFENYIELNMADDFIGARLFEHVRTVNDFYIQVSTIAGDRMKDRNNTIIFIDEIQIYPHLFSILKPLRYDNRFKYICSGSLLGVTLRKAPFIPMGSFTEKKMYPMDFEEFLWANHVGSDAISYMKNCFESGQSLDEATHNRILSLFKTYLYVGGLPDAVKAFVETHNVYNIRSVQTETHRYYSEDAARYDQENRLKILRIYEMIPSTIDNKVKRIKFNEIEGKANARFNGYQDEFDYLRSAGIALGVNAVSEPRFPLIQSSRKNLIKLYMNDVGILTNILYSYNINALMEDRTGINLGAVYETAAAQEIIAHHEMLYYYDRRKVGEVDYLLDDFSDLSVLPVEIKSGREGYEYSAISKMLKEENSCVKQGYIFSNNREVRQKGNIKYYPIYFIMFV